MGNNVTSDIAIRKALKRRWTGRIVNGIFNGYATVSTHSGKDALA